MKSQFRLIGVSLMLILLIGVTSGFTLMQHICLMACSNESTSSIEMDDCCGESKPDADRCIEQSCCTEQVSFVKFDYTALAQQQAQFMSLPVDNLPLPLVLAKLSEQVVSWQTTAHPPPLHTGEFLALVSVFRI
ncbi:MAG TPA: hypothetical protein PKL06_01230 [Chitinophagales bacterium]|jgi:hypothetical protein|nr:hypothetical protein [Chitinophagales bacterium]